MTLAGMLSPLAVQIFMNRFLSWSRYFQYLSMISWSFVCADMIVVKQTKAVVTNILIFTEVFDILLMPNSHCRTGFPFLQCQYFLILNMLSFRNYVVD